MSDASLRDKEAWQDMMRSRNERLAKDTQSESIAYLAQAQVPMQALVSDPNWKAFTQMVQAKIEEAKENRERIEALARRATSLSFEDLAGSKMAIMILTERIAALEEVRDIPHKLLKEGGDAPREDDGAG